MEQDSEIEEETRDSSTDRRRDRRVEVEFPVRIQAPTPSDARAVEMSPGGLRLESTCDFTHAVHVSIRFELPNEGASISALADIRWHEKSGTRVDPTWVYGLQFSEIDDDCAAAIRSFVQKRIPEETREPSLVEESAVEA